MTELAQEVIAAPEVIRGMEVRGTVCGDVVFINTDYVTSKTIDILVESLNQMGSVIDGHGLYTVVFRLDGRPRVLPDTMNTWIFNPDAKSAICNLSDCVDLAFSNTMNADKGDAVYCNVSHVAWKNILSGFFHEAHHAESFNTDYDELSSVEDDARVIEELRADEFSQKHCFHMVKLMDMEPEFGDATMALMEERWEEHVELINEDKNPDDHSKTWLMVQTHMAQTGSSFFFPAEPDSGEDHQEIGTFKEFMRTCSTDEDDPSWDLDTTKPEEVVEVEIAVTPHNETAEGTPGIPAVERTPTDTVYADNVPSAAQIMAQPVAQPVAPAFQGVQEQFVPATATMAAPAVPGAPALPPVAQPVVQPVVQPVAQPMAGQIDPAGLAFQAAIKSLYVKMFHHIFQTCGYNPQMPQVFGQKDKIVDMLPLTPEESNIVAAMDCYNELGQVANGTPVQNWLSGVFIDKAQQLPGYVLTLNTFEGVQIFRKFVPQNPNKVNFETKQPTKPALDAKAGNQILWVINPQDPKGSSRVYNGVYQRQDGYDWVAI